MNQVVFIVLQVLVGIVVSFIMYLVFLKLLNIDTLVTRQVASDKKEQVIILDGALNSNETSSRSENNTFNTTLPFMKNYMPIAPSVNSEGGTQFSYSFWLYVKSPQAAVNKTIFLKGDKKEYTFNAIDQVYDPLKSTYKPSSSQVKTERVVLCPQVSFGENPWDFDIVFNSFEKMHEKVSIKKKDDANTLNRTNLLSLFTNKWVNLTMTFQDNSAINDYQKGIIVRFYVNGMIYHVAEIPGLLKQNRGNFYVFPDGGIDGCKIADLKYFNFALSDSEVSEYMRSMPDTTKSVSDSDGQGEETKNFSSSMYAGLNNQLDVYNT